jgi:MFS family permease
LTEADSRQTGRPTAWSDLVTDGRAPRLALIGLGTWLTAAETLMTATVMPSVAADIGGFAWFAWAVALYLTGSIVGGTAAGRLALRFGLRPAMTVGGLVYTLGCVVCALAPSIGLFLAGRLVQGIGGGFLVGLCFVAVTALFPQPLWPRLLSGLSGVWGAATLFSPLIGGLFAQAGFWRGAFWLFALQGAGFIVAVAALIPASAAPAEGAADRPPVGLLATLTIAILTISAAGLVAAAWLSALLAAAGCALLALLLRLNGRAQAPLLPRQAADLSSAVGAGLFGVFSLSAATASFTVYGPALFQILHGASPVQAGYVLGAEAFAWTAAALLVAGRRRQTLYIRAGVTLVVLSVFALGLVVPRGRLWLAAGCALMQGAGFGLLWALMSSRIVANTAKSEQALASSATPTTQMIGIAVGAAASGVIANLLGFGQGLTRGRAEAAGFWLFAAFVPLALVAGAAAWRLGSPRYATGEPR